MYAHILFRSSFTTGTGRLPPPPISIFFSSSCLIALRLSLPAIPFHPSLLYVSFIDVRPPSSWLFAPYCQFFHLPWYSITSILLTWTENLSIVFCNFSVRLSSTISFLISSFLILPQLDLHLMTLINFVTYSYLARKCDYWYNAAAFGGQCEVMCI